MKWHSELISYLNICVRSVFKNPLNCSISVIFGVITCCAGIVGIIAGSTIAQILLFLGVTCMCLNWALNMDMLMNVIVSHRRASATAIQTLTGHLFGDASSPYIIGFISDAVRGDQTSSAAKYHALQWAMFLPNGILILSIGCYLWATFYIVADHHRAKLEMHVDDEWASDVETLVPSVQPGQGDGISNILYE
uniref:Major facilitator superfamily MFS-1 domain containing protein n=1 Tax=Haemonchus contortus TaxID=6289 RepID=W6NIV9_HAECO